MIGACGMNADIGVSVRVIGADGAVFLVEGI